MATYIKSNGTPLEVEKMHPSYIVNALNKRASELAAVEPTDEQLQVVGRLAVELVRKGFALEAVQNGNHSR